MMRWIIRSSLRYRFLVVAAAVAMMTFGGTQLRDTSVDVFPEFAPPRVEIQTACIGLSSTEVEELITVPLEQNLQGVPGLDVMRSKSVTQLSSIELIFDAGTDLMEARQLVQERISTMASTLPSWASPPVIIQPLSATSRVMKIGMSSDDVSMIDLSMLAYWKVRARLLGVPGVANVAIWGQRRQMLFVNVDPARLHAAGVTLEQAMTVTADALDAGLLKYTTGTLVGTGGAVETPNQRLGVQHTLPILTAPDLKRVVVGEKETGVPIRLGDIANVEEGFQPLSGDAVINDGQGLMLIVEKLPWANTLDVTNGVDETLEQLTPGMAGIDVDATIFRPATFIEMAIDNLTSALFLGSLLVIIILVMFLFEWRSALISSVAIPLSLLAALLALDMRGTTINTMVLAGLVIAVGVVVDDDPHGNHQPGQHHRVDRRTAHVERQQRRQQRQRDRHRADQRTAPLEQEHHQDDDHQQRAEEQCTGQVVDRHLDERRRPEDRRVDVDAGHAWRELFERLVDTVRDVEGVRPGQLLDDQHQTLAVVDDRIPGQRLEALLDVGDVPEPDRDTGLLLPHYHSFEVGSGQDRQCVLHTQALVRGLHRAPRTDERAGGVLQQARVECVGGDRHRLFECHPCRMQPGRVDVDEQHLAALSPDRHIGDPGHAEESGAHLPVGQHRQVNHRDVVGRHPDLHHSAGRRQRLDDHRRRGPAGQRRGHRGDPLLHQLAGLHQVRAGVEDQLDGGQLGHRLRPHHIEPRHPLEVLLQGNRDQLLHLGRGQADTRGLDLHPRRRELGKHVDRRVPQLSASEGHHRDRRRDHEEPVPQARADDPAHHECQTP